MMATKRRASKKIGEKTLALRNELWPDIEDDNLWHRKRSTGYTTIPRTMTYILQVMNALSSGKPPAQTYLTLWCHTFDEYMITINNPRAMAFESGFTGQRAEAAWSGRMRKLLDLGFIQARDGATGSFNYVLILNPYAAIKNLRSKGEPIPSNILNSLLQRMNEIGANDQI
ncbi:hypothetical protein [Desulfofustis glycolicus]|nr:hypothetical protein [Desulfofustis glycolicus]